MLGDILYVHKSSSCGILLSKQIVKKQVNLIALQDSIKIRAMTIKNNKVRKLFENYVCVWAICLRITSQEHKLELWLGIWVEQAEDRDTHTTGFHKPGWSQTHPTVEDNLELGSSFRHLPGTVFIVLYHQAQWIQCLGHKAGLRMC